jgi:hypothetical protein
MTKLQIKYLRLGHTGAHACFLLKRGTFGARHRHNAAMATGGYNELWSRKVKKLKFFHFLTILPINKKTS